MALNLNIRLVCSERTNFVSISLKINTFKLRDLITQLIIFGIKQI